MKLLKNLTNSLQIEEVASSIDMWFKKWRIWLFKSLKFYENFRKCLLYENTNENDCFAKSPENLETFWKSKKPDKRITIRFDCNNGRNCNFMNWFLETVIFDFSLTYFQNDEKKFFSSPEIPEIVSYKKRIFIEYLKLRFSKKKPEISETLFMKKWKKWMNWIKVETNERAKLFWKTQC